MKKWVIVAIPTFSAYTRLKNFFYIEKPKMLRIIVILQSFIKSIPYEIGTEKIFKRSLKQGILRYLLKHYRWPAIFARNANKIFQASHVMLFNIKLSKYSKKYLHCFFQEIAIYLCHKAIKYCDQLVYLSLYSVIGKVSAHRIVSVQR